MKRGKSFIFPFIFYLSLTILSSKIWKAIWEEEKKELEEAIGDQLKGIDGPSPKKKKRMVGGGGADTRNKSVRQYSQGMKKNPSEINTVARPSLLSYTLLLSFC